MSWREDRTLETKRFYVLKFRASHRTEDQARDAVLNAAISFRRQLQSSKRILFALGIAKVAERQRYVKGVIWNKQNTAWIAKIQVRDEDIYDGMFLLSSESPESVSGS